MRVFLDANVPMYVAGGPHPLKEPARRILEAVATGRLDAWTDADTATGLSGPGRRVCGYSTISCAS